MSGASLWRSRPWCSLLGSLLSRCISLSAKGGMAARGRLGRVESATLGVVVRARDAATLVRPIAERVVRELGLRSLLVQVECDEPFGEVSARSPEGAWHICITSDTSRACDALLDVDSCTRWDDFEAIGTSARRWAERAGARVPIVVWQPRWERLLGHCADPGARADVLVERRGAFHVVRAGADEWRVPAVSCEFLASALDARFSNLRAVYNGASVPVVPHEYVRLVADQFDVVPVWRQALDEAAAARARRVDRALAEKLTGSERYAAALGEWESALARLGAHSLSVWLHDPGCAARGVWAAALDAWRDGQVSWPV